MDTIEIGLASSIFSADAVVRTMHRYSADYFTEVDSVEDRFVVHLTPKSPGCDTSNLIHRFRNDALDEQLRERVREETRGLQETLAQAALLNASVQGSSRES